MNLDDEIDLRLLDVASKAAFGTVERTREATRWYRRRRDEMRAWRASHPSTFDQVGLIVLAGLLECAAALISRRR